MHSRIKRWVIGLIIFIMSGITVFAQERILIYDGDEHQYTSKTVTIDVDGVDIEPDGMEPVIIDGRTLVPVREIMESEAIQAKVTWIAETETVIVAREDIMIELYIGSTEAYVNGESIELDAMPKLISDKRIGITKTMVPLRFIAESLGYNVIWNKELYHISLEVKGEEPIEEPVEEPIEEPVEKPVEKPIEEPVGNPSEDAAGQNSDFLSVTTSNLKNLLPTKTIAPLPTKLSSQSIQRSKNVSQDVVRFQEYTEEESYPLTQAVKIIKNEDESSFTLVTTSSLSSVHGFIWDNKLILDIQNINMESLAGTISTNKSLYTESIRTSQYGEETMTGRFVFDLKGNAAPREIVFNQERTELTVTFNEVGLSDLMIGQDGQGDYIEFLGDYRQNQVIRMEAPYGLIFDFSNSVNLLGNQSFSNLEGQFLTSVQLGQKDDTTVRLFLQTTESVAYTLTYDTEKNRTRIRLKPLQFDQVRYDKSKDDVVILPQASGMTMDYDYLTKEVTIQYDRIISGLDRQEVIQVHDEKYERIEIGVENDKSVVRLIGKKVYDYNKEEKEGRAYFYGEDPRGNYKYIVVIDPGHGGRQPGTSHHNVVEKDVNLKIMQAMKPYTDKNSDIKYFYTRQTDKTVSLQDRANLANALGADLFVAMHCNAMDIKKYPNTASVRGLEVFTTKGKTNSKEEVKLAEIIFDLLEKDMPTYPRRAIKDNNKLYVLKNTQMPSILIEYGYLTNIEDNALLQQDDVIHQLAEVTEKAIHTYLMN